MNPQLYGDEHARANWEIHNDHEPIPIQGQRSSSIDPWDPMKNYQYSYLAPIVPT